MQSLSRDGQQVVDDVARQHDFSADAVRAMLAALVAGGGRMAQFSHPEFGGAGQWMRGGMTMVGDMFNSRLKSRVDALCSALSSLLADRADLFEPSVTGPASPVDRSARAGAWWPGQLGTPNASGSQNGTRYAYFADARRLAVETDGRLRIHDTLDHRIGGVSQQQSAGRRLSFTSQHGPVDVTTLPVVSEAQDAAPGATAPAAPAFAHPALAASGPGRPAAMVPAPSNGDENAFVALEKLAALHAKGILSDDEFSTKKAELLRRI